MSWEEIEDSLNKNEMGELKGFKLTINTLEDENLRLHNQIKLLNDKITHLQGENKILKDYSNRINTILDDGGVILTNKQFHNIIKDVSEIGKNSWDIRKELREGYF